MEAEVLPAETHEKLRSLREKISVSNVQGWVMYRFMVRNPMSISSAEFETALRNSLSSHELIATNRPEYEVSARVTEASCYEVEGISTMLGEISVRYTVSDAATDQVVIDTEVLSESRATMRDAWLSEVRARQACSEALAANIRQFMILLADELGGETQDFIQISNRNNIESIVGDFDFSELHRVR